MNSLKRFTIVALLALTACKAQQSNTDLNNALNYDEDEMTTDSLINDVDETIEDFASTTTSSTNQKISGGDCKMTSTSTSEKNLLFVDQLLAGTRIQVNGSVDRFYNNASCSLINDGDSLLREHSLKLTHLYSDAYLESKSSGQLNYLGENIGGGAQLTNTLGGWELNILGANQKIVGPAGYQRMSISVKTSQPLVIQGTLGRTSRTLVSGQVKIYHNLAEYSSSWTPIQLAWNDTCKCPVSGVLEVDYEGSVTGGASIQFTSCGKAQLTTDAGRTKNLNLRRCNAI